MAKNKWKSLEGLKEEIYLELKKLKIATANQIEIVLKEKEWETTWKTVMKRLNELELEGLVTRQVLPGITLWRAK